MAINIKERKPKYYLDREGNFVIENYNFAKPFANFFPGIAGKYGIPMWVFYVNRGQGVCSFGIKDKDHAILEFYPANKAWQTASTRGFRTFIKAASGKKTAFYEPFHNGFTNLGFTLSNKMEITSSGLVLEEDNLSLGLRIKVEYFNIPNDPFAALARIVTLKNLSRSNKKIQLLDGLPQVVPFGTSNFFLKKLSRTIEAWMNIKNLDKGVPYYKLDVDPTDKPEVVHIKEGNFYLGFHYEKNSPRIITPIVNPQSVFGPVTDLSCPLRFLETAEFRRPKNETIRSKTPCAFTLLELQLKPQAEKSFYSVAGYARSTEALNSAVRKIIACGYLPKKKEENKKIIRLLQQDINTTSSCVEFDLYAKQTYLDNILRGGYPLLFKSNSLDSIFYIYSRKHGDLERDYNRFLLQPTYFSQGNGNYRDMNQNRRCDVWFNPDIKDENLIYFLNLLQADGFNPLVIKGVSFILKEGLDLAALLKGLAKEEEIAGIAAFAKKPFTPGGLIFFLEKNKIALHASCDEFIDILLSHCIKIQEAEHGEGFWSDHWTYNLDLLETYLAVYPEKLNGLFFERKIFTFFDNTEVVRPRSEKYLLLNGRIRQLHSVAADTSKKEMLRKRETRPNIVRVDYGKGEIYQTTLINKLLCLLANKLASLDPFGMGIEMEANKPNWFDSLNGLPALLGSSLCETFELKRLALIIKEVLEKSGVKILYLNEEINNFLLELNNSINEYYADNSPDNDYRFWDKSYSLKEEYRRKTKSGFSGKETEVETRGLLNILNNALKKIDSGIVKARDKNKEIYCAYFINEVADFQTLKSPFVRPVKFTQKKLPLFLEGQMHALRLTRNPDKARALHKATKASPLYDKKLKMYKVTAALHSMPEEIGRCRVFSPGWLENESVWLHMEYKYLLEILKQGLYEEFYQEFKNVLIPFQKPQVYGRSILENSSFIVSSAFPDKNLHGNGFVARLSGSTAEFLQIWLTMNIGKKPFTLNEKNELNLRFNPALAGWLFDKKNNTYAFNFLSKVAVIYHNPGKKDTFGKNGVSPARIIFNDKDGKLVETGPDTILSPYAEQIRSRLVKRIDIFLE